MKRALIGTGAHAREVISIINRNQTNIESISCMFVDDVYYNESDIRLIQPLSLFNPIEYEVIVAIGDSKIREIVVNSLPKNTKFFTYIDPTAIIGELVSFGDGGYIGPNSIITTNIQIGNHSLINRGCQIGHDTNIGDYLSMMPGSIISGNCILQNSIYIGTNSSIKEKIEVCSDVTIGLNSGVVKHITQNGTYVGTPSKKIK